MELLKGDIINNAYSELRISGLTVNPRPEDNRLALRKLEALAHEYIARNIDVGYFFENDPDTGSPSGVLPQYSNAFSICLAERLITDFGKGMSPDPILMKSYSSATSFLSSNTVFITPTTPSSRMPRGSGNTRTWPIYSNFSRHTELAPNSAKTEEIWIGDINDYEEDYQPVLKAGEDIDSYTIDADDGLDIVSDSLFSPIISYRIKAISNQATDTSRAYQRVKIVSTTTDGRVMTRYINFTILETN
jgi:hypothetical protein